MTTILRLWGMANVVVLVPNAMVGNWWLVPISATAAVLCFWRAEHR